MELEEFKSQYIRKSRTFKVTNSWGVYDAYKHIRKNGWYDLGRPVKEGEFYAVVRKVNDLLALNLGNGDPIDFPCRMGRLELRKYERGVSLVDGTLKVTYPIDWSKTWKLWYEDSDAMRDKLLVRNEQKWVYHVRYCKNDANYENKCYYDFSLNRAVKHMLKDNIQNRQIDTLW